MQGEGDPFAGIFGMGGFGRTFGADSEKDHHVFAPSSQSTETLPGFLKNIPQQDFGHPHNLEAERSILGAIFINNELIHTILETGLEKRDFYKEAHQIIFEMMLKISQKGEPIDLVTLKNALQAAGCYDKVRAPDSLTELFQDTFSVGNVGFYAKIVRDKALLRRLIIAASEIVSEGCGGVEDLDEFVDAAERKIFEVSDTKIIRSLKSIHDIAFNNLKVLESINLTERGPIGLKTGFHEFDRLTNGLRPGQLIIIAARPGMGKTSLFLSMAQNIARDGESTVAIFSLEMSDEELGLRFLSGIARIEANRLKMGNLNRESWDDLVTSAGKLSESKIFIDDSSDLTVLDIRSRCRRLLSVEKKLNLIVVDYLQLMKGSRGSRGENSREREISEISRGLKNLSKELKVPIIALSQLNRGVESRPEKRPMLSDLRESGAIEQDADLVCFIYRDEVYNKETKDKGIAELIVAKHRAGETSTIRLSWLSRFTQFANLDPNSAGTPFHSIE